jgi:uncharacterized membrane protein YphA (DoxX/SURF4 family)
MSECEGEIAVMSTDLLRTTGRILYALAITGFGVLCLGYVDFVSALQSVPEWMPAYRVLAIVTGVILLAAGLAIMTDVRTRFAARVLIVFFACWILLLDIPGAIANPVQFRSPFWIRTFETVALMGAAVILAEQARPVRRTRWIRSGAIAYGMAMPVFGVLHLVYPESVATLIPPWYPAAMFLAWFTGVAQVAAGLAIVAGILPRLAATLAGVMYGTWAVTLHIPYSWCRAFGPCTYMPEVVGLQGSRPGLTSLFVAIGMCGAAWIVAGSYLPGRAAQHAGHAARPVPEET